MILKKLFAGLVLFVLLIFSGCGSNNKPAKDEEAVRTVGSVKKTMWQGMLNGIIDLDTIQTKEHLYGLGPLENLTGEIVINDGKAYKSTVLNDTGINVEETYKIKAPLFVYTHVNNWQEQAFPDSIQSMNQLDFYIGRLTQNIKRPFAFKIACVIDSATIYIIDVPEGTAIHSPGDADQEHQYFKLQNQPSEIIGFFSNKGSSIFAQGETHLHMHLLTADKAKMGHIEEVSFKKGTVKLYLPQE